MTYNVSSGMLNATLLILCIHSYTLCWSQMVLHHRGCFHCILLCVSLSTVRHNISLTDHS